jgi:NRAMP (natural resistance-associated macrophage protein)-like metal ion transporter
MASRPQNSAVLREDRGIRLSANAILYRLFRLKSNAQFREIFEQLGPGLITGAADDDPSGISTYSVTGATFGYGPLWTALFSFPLMCAVQLMCARLGLVTGRGLAGAIRRRYPRWVLWSACLLLVVANVFNIAADLAGMSDAMMMVTKISSTIWTPIFAVGIIVALILSSYKRLASIFKFLTLSLFAYVITAFLAHADWREVLRYTFIPRIEFTREYLAVLVGILGTTISPYLFFWQASEEVEEEREKGRHSARQRRGAAPDELRAARNDVAVGMFFSNLVMYFIILTSAATLHAHGRTDIQTATQAAEALRPLAGNGAYLLFTIGIVGTGVLAVPVLAGSCAYAISEALAWRASLNAKPRLGRKFYGVLAVAVCGGFFLDLLHINSVKMLFASAVLNGVLAPPLIVLVLLLTSDRTVMGEWTNGPWLKILGWTCAGVMAVAAVGMFIA